MHETPDFLVVLAAAGGRRHAWGVRSSQAGAVGRNTLEAGVRGLLVGAIFGAVIGAAAAVILLCVPGQ